MVEARSTGSETVQKAGKRPGNLRETLNTQTEKNCSEMYTCSVTKLRRGHRQNSGLNKELNHR